MTQEEAPWVSDAKIQELKFSNKWVQGFLRRVTLRRRRSTSSDKGLSASDAALSGGPDGLDLSRCELCDAVSGGGAALAKVVVTLRAASRCDAQGRELRRGPRRRTARARPPRLRTPSRRPQRQLRRSDRSSRRLRVRLQRRVRTVFRRRERARALMHRRTCDLYAVSGGQ